MTITEPPVIPNDLTQQIIDAVRPFKQVIELIAQALHAEAENRGWCEEYNTFATDLNDRIDRLIADRPFIYLPAGVNISFNAILTAEEASELESLIDRALRDQGREACTDYEWEFND